MLDSHRGWTGVAATKIPRMEHLRGIIRRQDAYKALSALVGRVDKPRNHARCCITLRLMGSRVLDWASVRRIIPLKCSRNQIFVARRGECGARALERTRVEQRIHASQANQVGLLDAFADGGIVGVAHELRHALVFPVGDLLRCGFQLAAEPFDGNADAAV